MHKRLPHSLPCRSSGPSVELACTPNATSSGTLHQKNLDTWAVHGVVPPLLHVPHERGLSHQHFTFKIHSHSISPPLTSILNIHVKNFTTFNFPHKYLPTKVSSTYILTIPQHFPPQTICPIGPLKCPQPFKTPHSVPNILFKHSHSMPFLRKRSATSIASRNPTASRTATHVPSTPLNFLTACESSKRYPPKGIPNIVLKQPTHLAPRTTSLAFLFRTFQQHVDIQRVVPSID